MPDPNIARLALVEIGAGEGPAVVFLHGFGGLADDWQTVQSKIAGHRSTLAFDLPGHGGSIDYPNFGQPKLAARAVINELAARGIEKAHLVGFSMGGAVASLIGLMAPERVASMTLLAPGGFGREINHRLLRQYAKAETEQQLRQILPLYYGFNANIPETVYQQEIDKRRRSGAVAALTKIAKLLFGGDEQGVIAIQPLVDLGVPIKVLWGTQDNVLPTRHCHRLPGEMATHVFANTGHSLINEQPQAVCRLILENISGR